MRSEPRSARTPVWPLSLSLAATNKIDVSFSSSGYLDVSVHRVPSVWLWIHHTVAEGFSAGFPHSDISGSKDICSSPKLFAAYHVFHRLLVPRHPPCALISLTNWLSLAGANYSSQMHSVASFGLGCLQNLLYCFPYDQSLDHMASDVLIFNWIINSFLFNMRFSRYVSRNLIIKFRMEMERFELLTPCLQGRCSPNWATPPLDAGLPFCFQKAIPVFIYLSF